MPSGPSSPRSASIPRSESSPSGTQALTATNPTESHGHVSNNGQQDPASPTKLSWNHLRQGESHQRIRHGAKQLLRLTESFSAFDGAGPAGGHDTAHEHTFPTDDDLRTMSRLSHSIARDINEIRALRKDDPNAQNQKRKTDESSQQQAAFRNDASDRGDPPARRPGRRAEFSCHKCHRVETPEWRPGPDGPGTLCNVCGLIYAKRERKKDELTMPTFGPPSFS
ncbi:Putative Zinc finger, GATA-type, Zinc finger, NHR/GATA-type [Colletotrichum destructivum]|uniref:Zinc finger, GATA-type, Zinc finger, NHR/GATA-type n=1 Tax=Colletotrichum destructivum TaxID=34406 RepID=A0AAX4INQ1_9PEZI|nr:Putative Zinc finger, GATA-type, Zinc finger, NHR/GATA-type [Colletotrichum destructivum]